jgi:hypothetical protein
MPQRSLIRRLLRHLFLVSLASCLLAVFSRGWDEWDEKAKPEPEPEAEPQAAPDATPKPARRRRTRFATTLSFSILFFAGLALSAGAGNTVRALLEDGSTDATATATTDTTTTQGTEVTAQAEAKPVAQATPVAHATAALQSHVAQPQASVRTAVPAATPVSVVAAPTARAVPQKASRTRQAVRHATAKRSSHGRRSHSRRSSKPKAPKQPLDTEAHLPGATVWLYQAAPDPTPPAARLRVRFARELVAYSHSAGVDWALVLAVLRADGRDGRSPATRANLRSLSLRLARVGGRANGWAAALSYSSNTAFADRVVALRHYYRAVGLASLVSGLLSQKSDLEDRVLHDPRISIYGGGRSDIAAHKVDVRVLATVLYLAETFHQVTVSCLISGHRLYARPGVISAHIYGRAVDIAGLGGVSIYGHQQPGGVTEQAVRSLLMLPGGMLPTQIISLLGLGGPSFPLANHYDHIHIGF